MTELQWVTTEDPTLLLHYPGDQGSARKQRLFACACCRRIWDLLTDIRSRNAIEVAERFADGLASKAELFDARVRALEAARELSPSGGALWAAVSAATFASGINVLGPILEAARVAARISPWGEEAECCYQCRVLRDLFRNPFRRVNFNSTLLIWNGCTIPKLAQAIYDSCSFSDLPILADALEEAGCDDADILSHCRLSDEHVRGCWVVDLLLGKA